MHIVKALERLCGCTGVSQPRLLPDGIIKYYNLICCMAQVVFGMLSPAMVNVLIVIPWVVHL